MTPVTIQDWSVGTAISDIIIPVAASSVDPTYAVVGSLPDGIAFDADTRTLSGTPTTSVNVSTITIRATNSLGNADYSIRYLVRRANPTQTITLPISEYELQFSIIKDWQQAPATPLDFDLAPPGVDLWLQGLRVITNGQVDIRFASVAERQSTDHTGDDLSDQFERQGQFILQHGTNVLTLNMVDTSDSDEPYTWQGDAAGTTFFRSIPSAGTDITLIIRGFTLVVTAFTDNTGDDQSWIKDIAIAPITIPRATGTPTLVYTMSGVPAGINVILPTEDTDGSISGTPTAAGSGTITITATNSSGSDNWTLAFRTVAAVPVALAGQPLKASGTIARAALVVGTILGVTLTGQVLAANGAISSAALAVGAIPGTVVLAGQTLAANGAIGRAALNVGAAPSAVVLAGQVLTSRATITKATVKILLALKDWPVPSGQVAIIRALIEAGGNPNLYNVSPIGSRTGTLIEGDLTLVTGMDITRIRNASGDLRINDQPSTMDLAGLFGTGSVYENATWYLVTLGDEESVGHSSGTGHGNNLVANWSGGISTLLNGLAQGERFILGLTLPSLITVAGQPLSAVGTVARASLVAGGVTSAVLSGQALVSKASIARATLEAPTPAVTLAGQALAANGAIAQATLAVGTIPVVTFAGQPLIANGAISQATVAVGAIPTGVVLSGQVLTSQATIAEAILKILLRLSDSDDTGLDVEAKALLVASAPGTPGNNPYADSDHGGSDTPLAGELGLGDNNVVISRFRRFSTAELIVNDKDRPTAFNLGQYFNTGGAGNNLTLYMQTQADGEASFAVASVGLRPGGGFTRFTIPSAMQSLLDNLATGDRWIVKFARPLPTVIAGQPLTAVGAVARAELIVGTAGATTLRGRSLTASGTIGQASLVTRAVPGVTLAGQPLTATAALTSAALVSRAVSAAALAGQTLAVQATLTKAALTSGTILGVTLAGQPLTAAGAISQATVVVRTVPGVTFTGQALVSNGAISQATVVAGTAPTGVVFAGQVLTAQATIAKASIKILLRLSDSDDTGLDVEAKALLVASAPGTAGNNPYANSDRGGTDTPLDGELGLGDSNTVISRFRRFSTTELILNDSDKPAALNIGAYFATGGAGNDLTLYLQTQADGEVSFAVTFNLRGGNFIRITLPQTAQDLLNNLATGDRWIVKFARPLARITFVGQALTANGAVSQAALNVGTLAPVVLAGQTLAVVGNIARAELIIDTLGITTFRGSRLTVLGTIGQAALVTGVVPGVVLAGQQLTAVGTIARATILDIKLSDYTKIGEVRGISFPRTGLPGDANYNIVLRARDRTGNAGLPVSAGKILTEDLLDVPGAEFVFRRNDTGIVPDPPLSTGKQRKTDNYIPTGWSDNSQGVNVSNKYEYISSRTGSAGRWSEFGPPGLYDIFLVEGETTAQFIFRRTASASAPNAPRTNALQKASDSYIPSQWVRNALGTTEASPYEWASYRLGNSGNWSVFYPPTLREAHPTARSPIPFFRAISGSSWSNSEASLATTGNNVTGDRVTLYNTSSNYTATRVWNGSAWVTVGKWIDGNLIVEGTVLSIFDIIAGAAVQSSNYDQGVAGWRIAQDGGVEFDAAAIRGVLSADHIDADVQNVAVLWEDVAQNITSESKFKAFSLSDDIIGYDIIQIGVGPRHGVVQIPTRRINGSNFGIHTVGRNERYGVEPIILSEISLGIRKQRTDDDPVDWTVYSIIGVKNPGIEAPGVPSTPLPTSHTTTVLKMKTSKGSGGTPIRYRWRYSTNNILDDNDPTIITYGTPTVTIRGLTRGTRYWIYVRAENSAGESLYSHVETSTQP